MNSDYLKRWLNAVAAKGVQTRNPGRMNYSETGASLVDPLGRMNNPMGSKRAINISRKIATSSKKSRANPEWLTASDRTCRHGMAMPGEKEGSISPGNAQTPTMMSMT